MVWWRCRTRVPPNPLTSVLSLLGCMSIESNRWMVTADGWKAKGVFSIPFVCIERSRIDREIGIQQGFITFRWTRTAHTHTQNDMNIKVSRVWSRFTWLLFAVFFLALWGWLRVIESDTYAALSTTTATTAANKKQIHWKFHRCIQWVGR